jgi:hypothetical protein
MVTVQADRRAKGITRSRDSVRDGIFSVLLNKLAPAPDTSQSQQNIIDL